MTKSKKRILCSVLIIAVLVSLYSWRVYRVNADMKPFMAQTEYFSINEKIDIGPNFFDTIAENPDGYFVTVKSCTVTTYGEFIDRYHGDMEPEDKSQCVYDIEVEFENTGNTEGYINLARYALQGYGIQAYQDYTLLQIEEPKLQAIPAFKLKEGDTKTYHLPFVASINDERRASNGYLVGARDLFLAISQYPVKKMIKVQF